MAKMLDLLQGMQRGAVPPAPIATVLGFNILAVQPGEATIAFEATERFANPMGTLHGGILCDIADAAMSCAYASLLGEGESFTTLELKINFLRPVWKAKLRAAGKVLNAGRTIGLAVCDILDEEDRLVAHATSTFMTLRGDQAKGR
jgi:uncharacterized protein (TIGR00369 family)